MKSVAHFSDYVKFSVIFRVHDWYPRGSKWLTIFNLFYLGMVSMMNAFVNTETLMSGSALPNYSTIFLLQPWWRTKFSASMVVYHHQSIHWIRSANLIVFRRLLTRAQSVICSGLILMTDVVGVSAQEVLATPSVKTSRSSSIIRTTSQESQELISSLWTDTIGHTSET